MSIFDKEKGDVKPSKWPHGKGIGGRKPADLSLRRFQTKIPDKILDRFVRDIAFNGDKIQTVIKRFMEEYSEKTRPNLK